MKIYPGDIVFVQDAGNWFCNLIAKLWRRSWNQAFIVSDVTDSHIYMLSTGETHKSPSYKNLMVYLNEPGSLEIWRNMKEGFDAKETVKEIERKKPYSNVPVDCFYEGFEKSTWRKVFKK